MNISKTALWLSVLVAVVVLLASGAGLLLTSTYARETASWAVQGIGQDIVNLVAALGYSYGAPVFYGSFIAPTALLPWSDCVCPRKVARAAALSVPRRNVAKLPTFVPV